MTTHSHEELCLRIVDETPDAVIFADREGIIRLWNRGAEEMFGFSRQEALGQSLDIIVPEKLRKTHWDGYFEVIKTGYTRYGKELLAVPGLKKDGSRVSLEFSIAMLKDEAGQIEGFSAVLRDVTKAWQEKKALKERLAALEAEIKK